MTTPDRLLADLSDVGITVHDVWDLVAGTEKYPAAVPVLVSWLDRLDDLPPDRARERLREGILRALSVPEARPTAAASVLRQFHVVDDPSGHGIGWVAGSALGIVADASVADEVMMLLLDRGLGRAREMMFEAVPRIAEVRPDVVELVRTLLDDESVRPFVIATLRRLTDTASRDAIVAHAASPHPLVRRQATLAVECLDEELARRDQERRDRLARFLDRLSTVATTEPFVSRLTPVDPGADEIVSIVYRDWPAAGHVTGFTFGLSGHGQPARELTITVRTNDTDWAKVPARLALAMQGRNALTAGRVFGYANRLVAGSPMTSVLLGPPANQEWSSIVDLVELVGVYPIYGSERDLVQESGVDALWSLAWDRLDPFRLPVA